MLLQGFAYSGRGRLQCGCSDVRRATSAPRSMLQTRDRLIDSPTSVEQCESSHLVRKSAVLSAVSGRHPESFQLSFQLYMGHMGLPLVIWNHFVQPLCKARPGLLGSENLAGHRITALYRLLWEEICYEKQTFCMLPTASVRSGRAAVTAKAPNSCLLWYLGLLTLIAKAGETCEEFPDKSEKAFRGSKNTTSKLEVTSPAPDTTVD